ncbi:hypothetical protein GCM10009618_20960 [Nesterenkonia lacusekhoensis]
MTLGLDRTEAAIINAIPSLPIHSSVLLVLVAGLFLAALVVRAQRVSARQPAPQKRRGLSARRARAARRGVQRLRRQVLERRERRANMTVTTDSTFTIRWGRTLVALVGVVALLTAVVTGVLAAAGSVLAATPLTALGVFVLSVVTLRSMAVVRRRRQRRRRIESVMREAMYPDAEDPALRPAPVGAPYDALSSDVRGVGGPNSLQQVDEDGLPVEVERTFGQTADEHAAAVEQARRAAAQGAAAQAAAVQPQGAWEPREVPKPKYLEAEKAQRPLPQPLVQEEAKRPSTEVRLSPSAQAAPPQKTGQKQKTEKSRSMDLDEVLKRRRA